LELTDALNAMDAPFDAAASAAAAPATGGGRSVPDARTSALVVIALVVALAAIHFAAAFLIPLVVSVFLSYTLSPLVARLQTWGVPRVLGATIVMFVFAALCAGAVYRVGSDAADLLELLPQAVEKVRVSFAAWQRDGVNPLHHMQETAAELEKLAVAAQPASAEPPAKSAAPPAFDVRSFVLLGTGTAIVAAGEAVTVLFLTFFLLIAGNLFRRKLIHVVGHSLQRRKIALRILDEVHRLNQHYFAVILVVNVAVGVATGLAMHAIGVDRALVWGVAAAVLCIVPYLGAAALAAAAGLAAFVQLGSLTSALLAIGLVLAIAGVLGIGLQTWLMGRAARMNAPAVLVALLFWAVLWGGWGLLLGVPIMLAAKTACDRIQSLRPWGALLGP
jgi:predicted PurR-regulated permease PerM